MLADSLCGINNNKMPVDSLPREVLLARTKAQFFFQFGAMGAILTYLGLFLTDRGFDFLEIGFVYTMLMVSMSVGSFTMVIVADALGQHTLCVTVGMTLGVCVMCTLPYFCRNDDLGTTLIIVAVSQFFWSGSRPILDAAVIRALAADDAGDAAVAHALAADSGSEPKPLSETAPLLPASESDKPIAPADAEAPAPAPREGFAEQRLWGCISYGLAALIVGLLVDETSLDIGAALFGVYGAFGLGATVCAARLPMADLALPPPASASKAGTPPPAWHAPLAAASEILAVPSMCPFLLFALVAG